MPQRLELRAIDLVAHRRESQAFAHDFAGGAITAGLNQLRHELLELMGQ
jgi:hypothetical protein